MLKREDEHEVGRMMKQRNRESSRKVELSEKRGDGRGNQKD